jgi:glyceraldehyde-3-phosphate dehydrogenase/erythrose-4-phosphate dehydrogenase
LALTLRRAPCEILTVNNLARTAMLAALLCKNGTAENFKETWNEKESIIFWVKL